MVRIDFQREENLESGGWFGSRNSLVMFGGDSNFELRLKQRFSYLEVRFHDFKF